MNFTNIRQLLLDQAVEAQECQKSNILVDREAKSYLLEMVNSKLITVVTGIRRSGKSTMALQLLSGKKFLYFNFDDEILGQAAPGDLNKILESGLSINPGAEYLFFDEIQNVEGWELFINRLQRRKYKIIITGSNSRLLSMELSSHLTGRHLTLALFPFSFFEFLKFKKVELPTKNVTTENIALARNYLSQYFQQGGFPQITQYSFQDRISRQYLKELFDKIVTRDIVQRRQIKNIKSMRELALLAVYLFSTQITYQSLRKACSFKSINTVKNYLEYLQESYLIFILEPYSTKIKERISLPKKLYVVDTALAEAIIPKTTEDFGRKLENIICVELRRRDCEIYYIKSPNYEVDFVIREGNKIVELIQVVWSLDNSATKQREVKALLRAADEFQVKKLTIVCGSDEGDEGEEVIDGKRIKIISAWRWL